MKNILSAALSAALLSLVACGRRDAPTSTVEAGNVSARIEYFASHGWEAEEISERAVTIPAVFSEAYERYAVMQDRQGLPLRSFAGRDAQLFVYEIKNYSPENKRMLAELLVCDDTAAASAVYSEDGTSILMPVS